MVDIVPKHENNVNYDNSDRDNDAIDITFTTAEKVTGLIRDQRIPLSAVHGVEVVPDGLTAVRGLRAPGLTLPGRRKIGTWRSGTGRTLVAVHGHRPAVRITLHGHRYTSLVITADAATELAASLSSVAR